METTLTFIKHDGLQRGLAGQIISRFEQKGMQLAGMKLMWMERQVAEEHYQEHQDKDFFPDLVDKITAGPILLMAWRGVEAVKVARNIMGGTNPQDAAMGTIRGDFGHCVPNNLIHGSDSPETARQELARFFKPEELHDYQSVLSTWLAYDE